METVRRADDDDVATMAELARRAAGELSAFRGGPLFLAWEAKRDPLEHSLRSAVRDPGQGAFVGCIDDVVVGYATIRLARLPDERAVAVIEDLFVEPEARAVGVGEAMMDEMLAWAKGSGAIGVDAWALPGARETKNFFEMSGFTARLLVMHHAFSGQAEEVPPG